jgi:hypothetical protein
MPLSIRTIYRTKYYKPCADLFLPVEAETLGDHRRPQREHWHPVDLNPVMHAIVRLLGRRISFLYFQIPGATMAGLRMSCRELFDDQRR